MIILGIDPGDTFIGYGVIKKSGSKLSLVDCGCIKPKTGARVGEKLNELETQVSQFLRQPLPLADFLKNLLLKKPEYADTLEQVLLDFRNK